ncbi:MAG: hypothetical protein H6681_03255 [Desulfobacteraceae bacterium]|nr:hypothetical protein [Desulfobacteraceae bacterium]
MKSDNFSKLRVLLLFVIIVFAVSGCATYGQGVQKTLDFVKQGDYTLAENEVKKVLKPDGDDRLLYYMELGSITRLGSKYAESNANFETAEKIADDLYTKRTKDVLSSMLLNPRQSPYPGNEHENVYLNYFKALNYMDMGLKGGGDQKKSFENARIELKRMDYKLKSYEVEKGNYKEVEDKKKQTLVKLLDIFSKFQGNWLDKDWLQFREDAYARYLSGIIYEISGMYDDARISYNNAAVLYEKGYAKQYDLDPRIIERAWFDTIRMMIKSRSYRTYEWKRIASSKLSSEKIAELEKMSASDGEIIVVEHLGLAPQRKELNLHLNVDQNTRSLYMYPILTGEVSDRNDQRAWFFLLYADKGILDIVKNYSSGGLSQTVQGLQRKTISLGPLWGVAENIGLIGALSNGGVRVTVPYYSPLKKGFGASVLTINGQSRTLIKSEDIGQLAFQNQLLNAGIDLNAALARTTMKNMLAYQAGNQLGGLALLSGKIAAAVTSAAETRNWLMLPSEIRVNRMSVSPGEYDIAMKTCDSSGKIVSDEAGKINIKPGEIRVIFKRTIGNY